MRAREVLLSEDECREVWNVIADHEDYHETPWDVATYLQHDTTIDGNVTLYEVRTALDYYDIYPTKERFRSDRFEREVENASR